MQTQTCVVMGNTDGMTVRSLFRDTTTESFFYRTYPIFEGTASLSWKVLKLLWFVQISHFPSAIVTGVCKLFYVFVKHIVDRHCLGFLSKKCFRLLQGRVRNKEKSSVWLKCWPLPSYHQIPTNTPLKKVSFVASTFCPFSQRYKFEKIREWKYAIFFLYCTIFFLN